MSKNKWLPRSVQEEGEHSFDSKEFAAIVTEHGFYQEVKILDTSRQEEVVWFRDLLELKELVDGLVEHIHGRTDS